MTSISRAWHNVRTSSFSESPPYAAGTTAFSQPASPNARTRDRQELSTSCVVDVLANLLLGPACKVGAELPVRLIEKGPSEVGK